MCSLLTPFIKFKEGFLRTLRTLVQPACITIVNTRKEKYDRISWSWSDVLLTSAKSHNFLHAAWNKATFSNWAAMHDSCPRSLTGKPSTFYSTSQPAKRAKRVYFFYLFGSPLLVSFLFWFFFSNLTPFLSHRIIARVAFFSQFH